LNVFTPFPCEKNRFGRFAAGEACARVVALGASSDVSRTLQDASD
jgi:hypothetical protein